MGPSVWRQVAEDVGSAHFNRHFTSLRALQGPAKLLAIADVLVSTRVLAIGMFRCKRALQRRRVPVLPPLLDRACVLFYNVNLGNYTDIGGGLYLPHGNVVVDGMVSIGRNCVIAPWVTIGTNGSVAGPRIGDDVFIGTGAKILGGIRVGDRAKIGANAVVLSDVPDGATVVGIPARRVK
jgi:serine O-acetyltransferase